MSRFIVYLLFVTIFLNGIKNSKSQEKETSVEETKSEKNESSTEAVKETTVSDSKTDRNGTPSGSKTSRKKGRNSKEERQATVNESEKDRAKPTEAVDKVTGFSKSAEVDLSGHDVMSPVTHVRTKFGDAVTRGFDGAKNMADQVYNVFRNTVRSLF